MKKAVEVYKMYSDRVNEETQEYIIKTLKEANLKIYTEKELKEREEKGIEKGISKTLIRLLTRKFGDISSDYKKKIKNANEHILTKIVDHIFEINKIEDLDEYLK